MTTYTSSWFSTAREDGPEDAPGFSITLGLEDGHRIVCVLSFATASEVTKEVIRTGTPDEITRGDMAHAIAFRSGFDVDRKDALHVEDEAGAWWYIPTRRVVTLRVEDRAKGAPGRARSGVGFRDPRD